jgi:cobalt-zinc-cadmium efflux system outer membrane protein
MGNLMCGWGRVRVATIQIRIFAAGLIILELWGCGPIAPPIGFRSPLETINRDPNYLPQTQRSTQAAPKSVSSIVQSPAPTILPISASQPVPGNTAPSGIDEFVRFALEKNPRIAKATFAIDAARGRYIQAGLYPNPELTANWDEIGDRTGPGGILTIPRFTQQIVTGHKLSLSQLVAATEVDRTAIAVMSERYAVIGIVRATYYETLALQRRIEILSKLVQLAEEAVQHGKNLLENKQIARLDLLQLEVERERFRAESESAERELPALRRKLAAVVGDPRMPIAQLDGTLDSVPNYDSERTLEAILATHPEIRSARIGVERAQAALRRAKAEPIPNVTVSAGYVRQYEFNSNDFVIGFAVPLAIWNRNQGNIQAAQAELGVANFEVARVENDLADRVATAFRIYSAAQRRAERYRSDILPRAEETHELSLKAFKGGQFEYLRVIQAQRAVAEARLEYNKSLGEAWKAAAELSGLLLEESWPGPSGKPDRANEPK